MDLGERARELRRAGRTIREIKVELGVRSNRLVSEWLRGVPPLPSVRGRKAKADLRAEAVELRAGGMSIPRIAAELGVAKSSVSVWVRGVALTDEHRAQLAANSRSASERRAATAREARIRRTEVVMAAAAAEIGDLSDRELFLVGVALYWAEGAKAKPWNDYSRVRFVNSDAGVIAVFLRWLALLGITLDDVTVRVAIHETADVGAATAHWSAVTGVPVTNFLKPTIKRHRPVTVRKNVGPTYVGCLVVEVRRSTELGRRIAGWWAGIAGRGPVPSTS